MLLGTRALLCALLAGSTLSLFTSSSVQAQSGVDRNRSRRASESRQPGSAQEVEQSSAAPSETDSKAGHGSVEFGIGFYDNGDSGDGNPFLDESLTVIEPFIFFTYNLTDQTSVWSKLSYDYISSASIERLSNYPQQSGASGDNYIGLDVGMRHATEDNREYGGFFSFSTEYDYNSIGLGGDVKFDLADGDASLKLSLSSFFDQVEIYRFDGIQDGNDTRFSLASSVGYYQIITPKVHGEFGITMGYQTGFLQTAYNSVVIEDSLTPLPFLENAFGTEVTEELPDTRVRASTYGKVRKLFDGYSVELGSRLYSDTWGISSFSLEPRYYTWLVEDVLRLGLRYRFYAQTAADDYDDQFLVAPTKRTQDSDLSDFSSHLLGVDFSWRFKENMKLEFETGYVARSDGLNQLLLGAYWTYEF